MHRSLSFSTSSTWLGIVTIWGLLYVISGYWPLLGFPFFYILAGLPLALLFFGQTVEIISLMVASSTISIILLYPAAILVAFLEGTDGAAIYQSHLKLDAFVVIGITLVFTLIALYRGQKKITYELLSFHKKYLVLIILAALFLLSNLNRADMATDEVDLGYRAYDLIDGMVAGRKGYTLSFYDHTPLALHANHFGFQMLENRDFRYLEDWMIRFPSAIIAFLSFLIWGLVFFKYLPRRQAEASWLLLAVLTPFLFSGRIFLREVFITFFLGGFFFFLEDWLLASIMLGAILLVKSTNFPLAILGIIIQTYWQSGTAKKKLSSILKSSGVILLIFTPILVYNAAAHMLTGYMDILFSKIFNIYHPAGYTGERAHGGTLIPNFLNLLRVQADQLTIPGFILLLFGVFKSLKQPAKKILYMSAIMLTTIFIFYWLVGFRAYYLIYLAPIMAMMIVVSYAGLKTTSTAIITSLHGTRLLMITMNKVRTSMTVVDRDRVIFHHLLT